MAQEYEMTPRTEMFLEKWLPKLETALSPLAASMGLAQKVGGAGGEVVEGEVVGESAAPVRLMKNITPGAAADADAARPVTASAGDYVIELLERQADILQASHEKLIKIENILHETRVQNKEIFIADMRARAEAAQDEKEAAGFNTAAGSVGGVDKVKDSKAKRLFGGVKEGAGKIMGGLGSILAGLAGGFGALLLPIAAVIGAFALKAFLIIGALGTAIVFFKDTNWEDMLKPLKGAFAFLKDIALSLWDNLKKVADVIEVAFMPMLRFTADALNDYLIQPLLSLLVPFWNDTLQPLVARFGEGLVTIKNFFKGIKDLRGAELRTAIIGGFMKMIDSLWDAIARSSFGKKIGMDTNAEKRAQEFEKRREEVMDRYVEREGVEVPIILWGLGKDDTGIKGLPENERAAARGESIRLRDREMAQIDAEEIAAASTPDATDIAIARGEAMTDSPGPLRQSMSVIESGVSAVGQAGSDAYAGLRIKGSSGRTQIGGSGQATGGGEASPGLRALARMIQPNVRGFERFTAFNDEHHPSTSLHAKGLALDFTLDDPTKAPAAAATVRRIATEAGVPSSGIDVLDEYTHPSPNATAGHIHAEFNTESAAMKMADGTLGSSPVVGPPLPALAGLGGGAPLSALAGLGGGGDHALAAGEGQPFGGTPITDVVQDMLRRLGLGGAPTGNAAALVPVTAEASRNGAGVAAATASHVSRTAGAPVIVTNVGGPPAPAAPSVTTMMPLPIPINARTEDQVLRALWSVNYV